MKHAFYFMLKSPFVLEIFTFLSWLFGYAEKRLDKKAMKQKKDLELIEDEVGVIW